MIYPTSLSCPACKATIHLDYEGRLNRRYGQFVSTEDLLLINIAITHSYAFAQDGNKGKRNINFGFPCILICKQCQTIIGIYNS